MAATLPNAAADQAVTWDGNVHSYLPPEGRLRPMPIPFYDEGEPCDPFTFEVVRHRLYGVVEEQGMTIMRVSGSPVATFAHDFATCLLTADAEMVYFGPYNQPQVGSIDFVTKWILSNRAENPGIADGDMFLCNDPWLGVPHQADVVIACPVFWDGKLLCWVGATMHTVDIGGSTPGGFCPDARDIHDEPLPTPAIKYVEGGEVRRDVEEMFLRRSRIPDLLKLDLRALIASNHVARTRILEIVERFGPQTVVGAMRKVVDDSERAVIARLDRLPDGVWTDHRFLDVAVLGDRGVYPVVVTLRKRDQTLVFSNEGTHPQVGALSTTVGGWRAGTLASVNPILGFDLMHATGGLLRRVRFEPVPYTILSAAHPTAVSNNQMGSSAGNSLAMSTVSRMLASSEDPELQRRAMAVASTPFPVTILSGTDRRGHRFGTLLLDPMGAGFGAFAFRDGADTGGRTWDPIATMPNVEYNERYFPVLYLYRRECPDSGGAGAHRGGKSGVLAITPHKTERVTVDVSAGGWALPWSAGLFGGAPGGTNGARVVRGAALPSTGLPQTLDALGGEPEELLSRLRNLELAPGDVYELVWAGGGGFGDPRARAHERVAADVAAGHVTPEAARTLYGVDGPPSAAAGLVPRLSADASRWLCPTCDGTLGANREGRYLAETVFEDNELAELTPYNRDPRRFVDADLALRTHRCAGCGQAVDAYVVERGAPEIVPSMVVLGRAGSTSRGGGA
jgi:N-methylhydantoinase B